MATHGFHVDTKDADSGPHACMGAFTTKTAPQSTQQVSKWKVIDLWSGAQNSDILEYATTVHSAA